MLHCNTQSCLGVKYHNDGKKVMSKGDDNDNLGGTNYLAWLLISLVTVIMLSLVLPFPISLVAIRSLKDLGFLSEEKEGIRAPLSEKLQEHI